MPLTAADVMTSPPIMVGPQAGIAEIAQLLTARHISAVPVCDAGGTLLGLVSEGDVIRPFRASARGKRDWWLSGITAGEELSQDFLDYLRRDSRTAADVMVRHVVTADASATLPQLAELMMKYGVKRLPILRAMQVVGIVSRSDVVAALARAPELLV